MCTSIQMYITCTYIILHYLIHEIPLHGQEYLIQHYVKKFTSDLRQVGDLPLRHRLFLSCDCHGVTDRICKRKSWLKCACFLYNIHVTSSACGFSTKKNPSKVNIISKVVILKHSVILFRCSMICRWPEPWNFKSSHFRILYSFPSHISALFLLYTKTYDAILLTAKVAR